MSVYFITNISYEWQKNVILLDFLEIKATVVPVHATKACVAHVYAQSFVTTAIGASA
jgi:hypothetical protein